MNLRKHFRPAAWLAVVFSLVLVPGTLFAGLPMASSVVNAKLLKLLETGPAFTAKAEFSVLGKDRQQPNIMPATVAFMDGKLRMEIDWSQCKGPEIPEAVIYQFKQLGMDQMTFIFRPDKKSVVSIFPKLKSYVDTALTKEESDALAQNVKIDKTRLGKETIDGHNCEKSKAVLTDDKGGIDEATVWNATDMKDTVVQVRMTLPDSSLTLKFKDIKLRRPDAVQFEAPAELTKTTADKLALDARNKLAEGK